MNEKLIGHLLAIRHCVIKTASENRATPFKHLDEVLEKSAVDMGMNTAILEQLRKLQQQLSKHQAKAPLWQPLAYGGGLLGLALAIGGAREVAKTVQKNKTEVALNKNFEDLMKKNPELRSKKELARQAFDALATFSPSMATKSLVADTFVKDVVNLEGRLDPKTIQDIAKGELEHQNMLNLSTPFWTNITKPFEILGGRAALESVVETPWT